MDCSGRFPLPSGELTRDCKRGLVALATLPARLPRMAALPVHPVEAHRHAATWGQSDVKEATALPHGGVPIALNWRGFFRTHGGTRSRGVQPWDSVSEIDHRAFPLPARSGRGVC
jgi:hypothetical protein